MSTDRHRRSPLEQGGLEVACELIFVPDDQKLLKKLKKIVSTHTHIHTLTIIGASLSEPHTSELNGEFVLRRACEPHTCGKFVYLYGMCVFRIWILPYLCVMQYFHMSKDRAKLATFEKSCMPVRLTYGIQRKERKAKA